MNDGIFTLIKQSLEDRVVGQKIEDVDFLPGTTSMRVHLTNGCVATVSLEDFEQPAQPFPDNVEEITGVKCEPFKLPAHSNYYRVYGVSVVDPDGIRLFETIGTEADALELAQKWYGAGHYRSFFARKIM